ncbi:ABC transporter substrate-binding protein [Fulvimarina endophytica]|uniref:ABC transporter substrate-binding protein n=1 Tax=Fulvimarina endophytica TaxID=2293836 RepID=A0A371WXU9_9HYPH|nr:ABC transporter substrate-binding protein [Fulvimarina endophytica]RFC61803.1 ABC transporter substrate-binding protein [Fulvimarina endophytica]
MTAFLKTLTGTVALAIVVTCPMTERVSAAEMIRIVEQFGTIYLPLHVIRDQKLIQRHAAEAGIGDVNVEWAQLSGGAAVNDALLSGNIDIAAAGIGPFLTLWDRTGGEVKVIGGLANQPNYLVSSRPDIQSLEDFGPEDRIALPAVGVSVQARILQMASEKAFGEGEHGRLDNNTVSLPHPDATAALLSGSTEIAAHLSNSPFQERALESPRVHRIFSSYDVLGGPVTPTYVYASTDFHDENPKLFQAFFEAFQEASAWIGEHPAEAAETYVRVTNSSLEPAFVQSLIEAPGTQYTLVPAGSYQFADFLYRIGAIRTKAADWKEFTFEELHNEEGN